MRAPAAARTVTIRRDWRAVNAFASRPENLPLRASGLAGSLRQEGGRWPAEAPDGQVEIRFAPQSPCGVLDHTVRLGDGSEVYVPLRAIANGDGAEVQLTLFRRPAMSDDAFAGDAEWVARDLEALRGLLEA